MTQALMHPQRQKPGTIEAEVLAAQIDALANLFLRCSLHERAVQYLKQWRSKQLRWKDVRVAGAGIAFV